MHKERGKSMKKRTVLLLLLAIAMALPAFAGGGAEKPVTINLYEDGSDNVRIVWEAVIEAFHKTNPGFTVALQYAASGTSSQNAYEKLIAAVQAKQKEVDIDLMEMDENRIARVLKEAGPEELIKIDPAKVPNMANVTAKSLVSPDRALMYRGTAVFIAYNSDKVSNPPKTDKEVHAWIKANPGMFAYNDPATGGAGGSWVTTSIYNQLPEEALKSADEKWSKEWDPGFKLLAELHPFLYKASGKVQYTVKNQGSLDLLASGSIWMCPAWADMILDQKSRKLLPASIKLQQITPSLTGNIAMLGIPKLSRYHDQAQKFLNYCVSVEAQEIFVRVMKAIPAIDPAKLPAATVELLSGLQMKTYRTATIGTLGTLINQRWTKEIATLP